MNCFFELILFCVILQQPMRLALMTSLDIDDALVLAAHVEQEALVTTEIRFVPSSKASKLLGLPASRTSRTMAKLNQDSQKSKIFLTVAAAMSFIIGFGLGCQLSKG